MKNIGLFFSLSLLCISCSQSSHTLFSKLDASATGISFRNLIKEDNPDFNIVSYPYYYNGAGVAAGDINNDGLTDLIFSGNMVKNRLYLNKGNLQFQDITAQSQIADKQGWCTGISLVDINQDGWLDIYICRSGLKNESFRRNLLYINNKDLSFTEAARAYGLDDPGYSTQASFFDYDKDGDLDMFLINQSDPAFSKGKIEFVQLSHQRGDSLLENKLFRNDQGHFTNVTTAAGIRSGVLTFSLGVSTTDINQDGWPDIYITNDFKEPDYFYINDGHGKFIDSLAAKLDNTSLYAMGCDVADYNNDLLPDILSLDMLPESNHAMKMHMGNDNYNQYNYLFQSGMFYQFMKNTLQKNNGDGSFSEMGQLACLSNTDWSWSPLMADFDNDGLRDIFISNGYKRDNTDIQFIVYSMDQSLRMQRGGAPADLNTYISKMPGIHIPNYIFRNAGNDHFENKVSDWGFNEAGFSHGALYADLDNDGDLDIITNNMDEYAGVYRNNSEELLKNHYLNIRLKGPASNLLGTGVKMILKSGDLKLYLEQQPTRGFQSFVDPVLHAGLARQKMVDQLEIYWPDGSYQLLQHIKADQLLLVDAANAKQQKSYLPEDIKPFFVPVTTSANIIHKDSVVNDFTIQPLLPHYYSQQGPALDKGDVNGDGMEDLFAGGGVGQEGRLYLSDKAGELHLKIQEVFKEDAEKQDRSAVFFDADGDKDPDLYVVSSGYLPSIPADRLQDRLYLNDGKAGFKKAINALPALHFNKSCVRPADFDKDGDMDLFLGGAVKPGQWPLNEPSVFLKNDGSGHFTVNNFSGNNSLTSLGIVNDAVWLDLNGDGTKDLVVASEWMPLQVLLNNGGHFTNASQSYFKFPSNGWYTALKAADLDGDGDEDLVAGNFGWNSQLKADTISPLDLYATDIDGNGSVDPVMTHYVQGSAYPFVAMEDMTGQVPLLRKKFYDYTKYANATITDILSPEALKAAKHFQINQLATLVLENTGNGFVTKEIPVEAQMAPVYAILLQDINKDGILDIVLAGNREHNRIRLGRMMADRGLLLLGQGKMKYIPYRQSGLALEGETRSLMVLNNRLVAGILNKPLQQYLLK